MASIFTKFFGRTVSEAAGFAAGVATGPVLAPVVEEVRQAAWEAHAVKTLDPEVAAEVAAEDVDTLARMADEAKRHGYDGTRFADLYGLALNAPDLGALFEAWRRDLIDDAAFTHGLRKAKLEPRWDGPLRALKQRLLAVDVLANARQQGFVDTARQHSESALQGVDAERADILFELSGNPPGPATLQDAANRGLIDRATFDQGIREGRTKTKYTELEWALRQPILHATDYATLHLKGWISEQEMNAGGALSGYTPEQMHLLYVERGRPAATGQLWTAAARAIDGPEGRPMDEAQFTKAIAESDIRPEYAPMLWDIRFQYPPLFQLSRLVQGNAISADTAIEWARKDRYAPEVVDALATFWHGGATAKADTHVGKAQSQLWSTLHRSYVAGESDETVATDNLTAIDVPADAQAAVLALWNRERELVRKQLTPAQVKKAYRNTTFTQDEAIGRLVAMGYSLADATTYLGE